MLLLMKNRLIKYNIHNNSVIINFYYQRLIVFAITIDTIRIIVLKNSKVIEFILRWNALEALR